MQRLHRVTAHLAPQPAAAAEAGAVAATPTAPESSAVRGRARSPAGGAAAARWLTLLAGAPGPAHHRCSQCAGTDGASVTQSSSLTSAAWYGLRGLGAFVAACQRRCITGDAGRHPLPLQRQGAAGAAQVAGAERRRRHRRQDRLAAGAAQASALHPQRPLHRGHHAADAELLASQLRRRGPRLPRARPHRAGDLRIALRCSRACSRRSRLPGLARAR